MSEFYGYHSGGEGSEASWNDEAYDDTAEMNVVKKVEQLIFDWKKKELYDKTNFQGALAVLEDYKERCRRFAAHLLNALMEKEQPTDVTRPFVEALEGQLFAGNLRAQILNSVERHLVDYPFAMNESTGNIENSNRVRPLEEATGQGDEKEEQ